MHNVTNGDRDWVHNIKYTTGCDTTSGDINKLRLFHGNIFYLTESHKYVYLFTSLALPVLFSIFKNVDSELIGFSLQDFEPVFSPFHGCGTKNFHMKHYLLFVSNKRR